jgi:hypothetical protein
VFLNSLTEKRPNNVKNKNGEKGGFEFFVDFLVGSFVKKLRHDFWIFFG